MRLVTILMLLGAAQAVTAGPPLETKIGEYLQPYVSTNNFQGVVLIARGEDIIFHEAYGLANIEHNVANQPQTAFHVASVSKSFTAAAVMLLTQEGKIDVAAPLSIVLPDYPLADQLTIHNLLAHTSGIPNINDFDHYEELEQKTNTTESLFLEIRDQSLRFEPGERYDYSNSNYNLLALIIERVSGRPYGDYLREQLFSSAGMHSTLHDDDPVLIVKNSAQGYAPVGHSGIGRARGLNWTVKTGNGSLISTAEDLQRWANAFFSGQIINSQTLDTILSEHTENVGYGWFIRPRHGRPQYHINGRSPGFSSYLGYYPTERLTVVVLSNLYNSIATTIGSDLAAIYLDQPYDVPVLVVSPPPESLASSIAGRYQFGPEFYNPNVLVDVQIRDGQLHLLWDGGPFETTLIHRNGNAFLDRTFWSDVEFVRDTSGVVTGMVFDGLSARRVR